MEIGDANTQVQDQMIVCLRLIVLDVEQTDVGTIKLLYILLNRIKYIERIMTIQNHCKHLFHIVSIM